MILYLERHCTSTRGVTGRPRNKGTGTCALTSSDRSWISFPLWCSNDKIVIGTLSPITWIRKSSLTSACLWCLSSDQLPSAPQFSKIKVNWTSCSNMNMILMWHCSHPAAGWCSSHCLLNPDVCLGFVPLLLPSPGFSKPAFKLQFATVYSDCHSAFSLDVLLLKGLLTQMAPFNIQGSPW